MQSFANLPIEVILNILCQVHIKHNKVMEVTAGEGVAQRLASQATAPFSHATHCIEGDLRCGLHMLQHHFQRYIGED